ncbi:MAG TPA: ATP-binding SpoIIE family protein phosphatase [Pyrinomonadaceae bacterium]|nr:ATP-binding SpoIIE family protein phosphatase [Pyrinomonadaceae bacterium]
MAQIIVAISREADIYEAQVAAREIATKVGFDPGIGEEIVLVATELATNLLRHAGPGDLLFRPLSENGRAGIQIESTDKGPGIGNVERAFADGYSTASGPGYGLGAVNRLMDELDISPSSEDGIGAHITCRRWLRKAHAPVVLNPFAIGVASRPHLLMPVNGDSFVVRQWGQKALVAVIDGLGHGPYAHRAAEVARQYVESHFDAPLSSIFTGVSRACIATRGVVMAAALFDGARERFSFASLGNVESRILKGSEEHKLPVTRGILGHTNKMPTVSECPWDPHSALVLHSDGLPGHWRWEDFGFANELPSSIAQRLLMTLARKEDDATVIVVKRAV